MHNFADLSDIFICRWQRQREVSATVQELPCQSHSDSSAAQLSQHLRGKWWQATKPSAVPGAQAPTKHPAHTHTHAHTRHTYKAHTHTHTRSSNSIQASEGIGLGIAKCESNSISTVSVSVSHSLSVSVYISLALSKYIFIYVCAYVYDSVSVSLNFSIISCIDISRTNNNNLPSVILENKYSIYKTK